MLWDQVRQGEILLRSFGVCIEERWFRHYAFIHRVLDGSISLDLAFRFIVALPLTEYQFMAHYHPAIIFANPDFQYEPKYSVKGCGH